VVIRKTIVSRTNVNNGYDASVKLEVVNRGVKNVSIKAELNNYYGDNFQIIKQNAVQWTKVNANKFESLFTVAENATVTLEWDET